jgi:glycosyltransferase involved in cell wall biosynthesis
VKAVQVVKAVHVVVPEGIDDPARPSGGNTYDRRLIAGLAGLGWQVHQEDAAGSWPRASEEDRAALGKLLARLRPGSTVVVDGLVASSAPELLVPEASRLRLVVLVHMPLGQPVASPDVIAARAREGAVLSVAASVVTPSQWSRDWLLGHYALEPGRLHVAEPGVDSADRAPGTTSGGRLLCVGAVTPVKGHDMLVSALAAVPDLPWRCDCVGALDIDPEFVDWLAHRIRTLGVGDRVRLRGPLTSADLATAYSEADLLVLPSRSETYGMVVTEALARGLPVVATAVGGVREALGKAPDGSRPGVLLPSDDAPALADALWHWLDDALARERLRQAAAQRRVALPTWTSTSECVSRVLEGVAA